MPFSEKIKLEAKMKSRFRCCVCYKPFVEIHHIVPEMNGGLDTIDNAAPLCASCHDIFGGNPEKRKQIKQMRDHWWDMMAKWETKLLAKNDFNSLDMIEHNPDNINRLKDRGIAIYHFVFKNENFEKSAQIIFDLVRKAQENSPNQKRILYLDIEGHKNKKGGFDNGMFELQRHFILGFLMPYLSEVHMPLLVVKNTKIQRNDLPDELKISDKKQMNIKEIRKAEMIYIADEDVLI